MGWTTSSNNSAGLSNACVAEWANPPPVMPQNQVESIPRGLKDIIIAKGGLNLEWHV